MASALAGLIMKLSGLSEEERAEIIANFEISCEKRWQCEACMKTSQPALRRRKGCEGGTKYGLALGGQVVYEVNSCIGNLWSPSVFHWMQAFQQYKNGIMPFDGALLDQPAKVIEIFSLLEQLQAEREEKLRKEAEKGRGGRGGR